MTKEELRAHLFDLLKAAIGAAITGAVVCFLNYLGAHIPDLLSPFFGTAGAFLAIKKIA
jgi:CBS-domain-containing membrane protein